MKTICIIIPYFGTFPVQFKFWLQSAYNNPSVDFLLFTNNSLEVEKNVKVIKIEFEDLKSDIQSKFNFDIKLSSPYKLCDYKGAYGYIFNEYIRNYDFWGFGDLDLVYGNIRSFITNDILSLYKIILGWGHLTFYENSEFCNLFFKEKVEGFLHYKDVFSTERNFAFDEFSHKGMSDKWKHIYPHLLWEEKPFDDVMVPYFSLNFKSVFNTIVSNNLIFKYYNNNLYRIYTTDLDNIIMEPILYAHFRQRKFLKVCTDNLNNYLIIPNAYISLTSVTVSKLKAWCRPRKTYRFYRNFKFRLNRKVKNIINFNK